MIYFLQQRLIFFSVFLYFFLSNNLLNIFAYGQNWYNDDLFSVTFPNDELIGWACGRWGLILHTSDGGKTWIQQESGVDYTLSSIFFINSKIGWAVGDEGTILNTSDGGKTWKRQKSPVNFSLMSVFFISPTLGWIVTEQTNILNTTDGGKTWVVQFKDEDFILKSVVFSDPKNGWAVGEYGFIYHTNNGGKTWKKQIGEFKISKETGDIVSGSSLFGLEVIDNQRVWAVGIDSTILRTEDGGKRWINVETGYSRRSYFGITSDKKNNIVIVGQGIGLISTDRGKKWNPILFEPPIRYSWLYGVTRKGSGFAAVGERGAIYFGSSNGPWRKVK